MKAFNNYLHTYAIWTAARASQRGFTSTKNIAAAINDSSLQKFAFQGKANNQDDFDEKHKVICGEIMAYLKTCYDIKEKGRILYGRAAKIMNIYLKTAVIIPNKGKGSFCDLIHPPIDRILLQNIQRQEINGKKLKFKSTTWTQFDESDYFGVIKELKKLQISPLWMVEKYWTPVRPKKGFTKSIKH